MIQFSRTEALYHEAREVLFRPLYSFISQSKGSTTKVFFVPKRTNLLMIEDFAVPIVETSLPKIEAYLSVLKKFGQIKAFEKHCGEVFVVTFERSRMIRSAKIIELNSIARRRAA